ncbi:MAG: manganese efflux pump MntP family protein [Propionibacteriaceae bacterium]|nr:manganese efflux pump MntP family protein [Propionibacteriaceae bacterium]
MDHGALLLLAVSLAMDAFAVSICNGMAIERVKVGHAVAFGAVFGGFQAAMPIVGFFVGSTFSGYVQGVGSWIAFGLLAFIGGKMLLETYRPEKDETVGAGQIVSLGRLLVLGLATSIDALAAGVSIALTGWSIWVSAWVIGAVTFVLSFIGVLAGKRLGERFEKNAGRLGGVVLVGIGVKILVQHLLGG